MTTFSDLRRPSSPRVPEVDEILKLNRAAVEEVASQVLKQTAIA
jgi:hypothetical protein